MTKLALMSDLHIDSNQFTDFEIQTLLDILESENIDWLHIAGDTANHFYETGLPFYDKIGEKLTLTYNLGNHDMLDLSEEVIDHLDFKTYQLGELTLLAFHGWYDYSFYPDKSERENSLFKETFWFDRRLKRPLNDKDLTQVICQRLERELSRLSGPIVVAMHFVPHHHFTLTHPKFQPFNAFLGSQRFHEIFYRYGVTDVVFGHAHRSYGTKIIDQIAYHSRPLGYIREWDLTINFVNQNPEYNPTGTWNLSKRYHAVKNLDAYRRYKTQHLATEFRNALTVLDTYPSAK